MAEYMWAVKWLVVIGMLLLTFGAIYAVVLLCHWGSELVDLMRAIREDKERRLSMIREHDTKVLNMQFEQQRKMMLDSGLIDSVEIKKSK